MGTVPCGRTERKTLEISGAGASCGPHCRGGEHKIAEGSQKEEKHLGLTPERGPEKLMRCSGVRTWAGHFCNCALGFPGRSRAPVTS